MKNRKRVAWLSGISVFVFAILPALAIAAAAPPPIPTSGSQTYSTPGTYTFTIPSGTNFTVQVWGGGGGGPGQVLGMPYYAGPGGTGGKSSFNGQVFGMGGAGGATQCGTAASGAGTGGSASGGDVNMSGQSGDTLAVFRGNGLDVGSVTGQRGDDNGGSAPHGSGGSSSNPEALFGTICGSGTNYTTGGGAGGYSQKTYQAGDFAPGSTVTVVVGNGGAAPGVPQFQRVGSVMNGYSTREIASSGGAGQSTGGGAGAVIITWPATVSNPCASAPLLCANQTANTASLNGQCAAGYVSINGSCVLSCPNNGLYENGMCVQSCGVGYLQAGNQCVFGSCPNNYTQQGSRCIATSCPSGSTLQNGACIYTGVVNGGNGSVLPPSIASWRVTPILLQSGRTTNISWSAQNVSSCQVTGDNGDSWSGASGAERSSAIVAQTTYQLTCTGNDGSTVSTSTVVNIAPTFQEH